MNSLIESLNLWGARSLHSALPMLLQASLLIVDAASNDVFRAQSAGGNQ